MIVIVHVCPYVPFAQVCMYVCMYVYMYACSMYVCVYCIGVKNILHFSSLITSQMSFARFTDYIQFLVEHIAEECTIAINERLYSSYTLICI